MTPPADILLVEDNEDDAFLFLRAFKTAAPDRLLERVADGRAALDFFAQAKSAGSLPALVLLDLQLPYFTGFDVLERLRADETSRHLPVVVFSSSTQPRDLARAYELGANSYLVKPSDSHELKVLIESLIRYWLDFNRSPPAAHS